MYEPIEATTRQELFKELEQRYQTAYGEAEEFIKMINEAYHIVATLERDEVDVIPRGGRSKPDAIEIIEAEIRLNMPEEVNGQVLKNEAMRDAWVTGQLAEDSNAQAARARQAEVQGKIASQHKMLEGNKADLGLRLVLLSHLDVAMAFHSVPPRPQPKTD